MSFANRHNRTTSNVFTYQQAEDAPYCKVKDLFAHNYTEEKKKPVRVRGMFIKKGGRYGDSATLICEGFNVNLPGHMVDDIDDMLHNQDDIDDINAGKVGAYAYEYVNSRGSKSYSIHWVDINPGLDISDDDLPY